MNKKSDLYDTLGVKPGADQTTIKAAYRRKAAKAHPDKGGVTEEFLAVQLAYDVLSDQRRRQRYDQSGDTSQPRDSVATDAVRLVMQWVAKVNHRNNDVVSKAAKEADRLAAKNLSEAKRAREAAAELRDAGGRFMVDGENLFRAALLNEAEAAERSAQTFEDESERMVRVSDFIKSYGYRMDKQDVDDVSIEIAKLMKGYR